jgi:alpha-beta hydrolase superfamily lysophospholipase
MTGKIMAARDTSWLDEIWPRLVVASGVGYLGLAFAVSRWLTRRASARVPAPTQFRDCAIETLTCRTDDGITLKGWMIAPPMPRGNVALFHGMRNNRSFMLDRIEFLTAAGYRCIAFDHRAHGESGGRLISFGYHERHDVAAVAALVRQRFAAEASRAFDAIILESVYHDLDRAFSHRIGGAYPAWFRHFRSGVIWLTERRLGARIRDVAPIAHVAHLAPRPILLLTGSEDDLAPPDEVRAFLAQIPEAGSFHLVPGARHGKVFEVAGPAYRDLLLAFLERHLLQATRSAAA